MLACNVLTVVGVLKKKFRKKGSKGPRERGGGIGSVFQLRKFRLVGWLEGGYFGRLVYITYLWVCSTVKHFRLIGGAMMNALYPSRNEGTLPGYHTIYHSIGDFPLFGPGSFNGRRSNNQKTFEAPRTILPCKRYLMKKKDLNSTPSSWAALSTAASIFGVHLGFHHFASSFIHSV